MKTSFVLLACAFCLTLDACGQSAPAHPEYGRVPWKRGFEAATKEARATHKPLLLLFQEVPG
ncbi:MAG TPA: hypothetical protein ENK43_03870 [Planctomycetes bacterium]|nr:hypothetical protein [Planctomycetota bacterium]